MTLGSIRVLIIGGGTGGISVASRLIRKFKPSEIAIVEPATQHYYQPLWTLVGAGVVPKEKSEKSQAKLIPHGVEWIQEKVREVKPESNLVMFTSGETITYEMLVIACGLNVNFSAIQGLEGQIGRNGICTIYDYNQAENTFEQLNAFKGGRAIFTFPPLPIKCAGAPQKIMYLADEIFRRNKVRDKSFIQYTTAGFAIFGVPEFAKVLMEVVKKKEISVLFGHRLLEVKAKEKKALFEVKVKADATVTTQVELPYDLIHVVPPMSAPDFVRNSTLAFSDGPQKGWLKVDQATLQHQTYKNIFGIGDVTGVPNSKTGAAIRKQAPIVVHNLMAAMQGRDNFRKYNGYSSCPLVTGFGKVILAEFGYDGKLMPTFPFDQTKERYSMWLLKKTLLPKLYWHGMMKGRA